MADYSSSDNWTNACIPIRHAYPDYVDLPSVQATIASLYAIVMVVGLSGNLLVVYSVFCKRVSFTVHSMFILSLAISDILITLTALPMTAISTFTREWLFGSFVCSIVGFVQGSGIFISSYTLMAIAIDRYCLVMFPTKVPMAYAHAKATVALIWLLGYASSSPLALFNQLVSSNYTETIKVCGLFCDEQWPSESARIAYGFLVLSLQYLLPLFVTTYCYTRIAFKLHHQIQKRYKHEIILPELDQRLSERRRKTNRMTMIMVASFMLAWCPMNLLNVLRDLSFQPMPENAFSLAFTLAHVIGMTSVVWNPLIYSKFNDPFRNMVQRLTTAKCTAPADLGFQRSGGKLLTETADHPDEHHL